MLLVLFDEDEAVAARHNVVLVAGLPVSPFKQQPGGSRFVSSRFTFHPKNDALPVWCADGRVVFCSTREGPYNLHQKAPSAGSEELLLKTTEQAWPTDCSSDGRFIAFQQQSQKTKWALWVLPLAGDRKPAVFLQTEFNEQHPAFSPDGKWIAYDSDDSGNSEIYVQTFPATGAKWQISTSGGVYPRWRRDGEELFYLAPDTKLMAVEVKAVSAQGRPALEAGATKALFQTYLSGPYTGYAVATNGQRFLMSVPLEHVESSPATLVVNWTAGLKQ